MKREYTFLGILLIIAVLLTLVMPAEAAEINSYGNAWVYDEANVISEETEAHIAHLNENVFREYAQEPQLAFIVLNDLPYSIDNYKLDMFNEFGVGTADTNRGMLFVLSVNDREYALEIGDGYAHGSAIRKALEKDFVTEEMKDHMRSGNYDAAIYQISEHLAQVMRDEENGMYAAMDAKAEQERLEQEAAQAALDEKLDMVGKAFLAILTGGGFLMIIGHSGYYVWRKVKRNKVLEDLFVENEKHLNCCVDVEQAKKDLKKHYENEHPHFVRMDFIEVLYDIYLKQQCDLLSSSYREDRYNLYLDALKFTNSLKAFETLHLKDLETIVEDVDEKEVIKINNRKENERNIEQFLKDNDSRIKNRAIKQDLVDCMKNLAVPSRVLTAAQLEREFVKLMDRLNFEREFDQFCLDNADKIQERDFNKDQFYDEIKCTSQYRNYSYSPNYNNQWMMFYLMTHMKNNKEQRVRKAAERQRQEQLRRKRQAASYASTYRKNNSSFGTSFRGGFSSGGGFKGKF